MKKSELRQIIREELLNEEEGGWEEGPEEIFSDLDDKLSYSLDNLNDLFMLTDDKILEKKIKLMKKKLFSVYKEIKSFEKLFKSKEWSV